MRICAFCVLLSTLLLIGVGVSAAGPVTIEKVNFFNQPNCYKLSNGAVDVIVTTDIGPRIIGYRQVGGRNILAELGPDAVVKTELGEWHPWGGHRLWHAPEVLPRTYVPDNVPIKFELVGSDAIRLMPEPEKSSGIAREMLVKLDNSSSGVTITHRLTNKGVWPIECAPWALTIVRGGGTTIVPQEPFISHDEKLLPARTLTLWNYTDLSDKRFTFLKKFILLRTDDSTAGTPIKIGVANKQGWAAYQCDDTLFVKRFPYIEGAAYPDLGCNFETYTDGAFMEVETVAPLVKLEPGQSATHVENWYLFGGLKITDLPKDLDSKIMPLVDKTGKR